jgi:subtilisin-like proprotein convertase family protein
MNFQSLLGNIRRKNLSRASIRPSRKSRRLHIESLEDRAVPAIMPAPVVDQTSFRAIGSDNWGVAMAADPRNPTQIFAASVTHGGNGTRVQIKYSTNGGTTWSTQGALGHALDPEHSVPTEFEEASDPNISWDRFGNVFLVNTEYHPNWIAGRVVLRKFTFNGTPIPSDMNPNVPGIQSQKTLYNWWKGDEAYAPNVAVDNNAPSTTDALVPGNTAVDPLSQAQTNAGNTRVFVTYSLRPAFEGAKLADHAIVMQYSDDGGTTFQAPLVVNDDRYGGATGAGVNSYVFSETVFTPGRVNETGSGGRMTTLITYNGGGGTPTVRADTLTFAAGAVPLLSDFDGATGPITDATDGDPFDTPVTTIFNIPVSGITKIDNMSLDLRIGADDLKNYSVVLRAPNGTSFITLIRNRTNSDGNDFTDGRGIEGDFLATAFADGAFRTINLGVAPYDPYWQPEDLNVTGKTFESVFNGLTAAQINGTWRLEVTDHVNGSVGSVVDLKLWLGTGISPRVGTDRGSGASAAMADDRTVSHPTKPGFAPTAGVGPGLNAAVDTTIGAFSPYQNRIYFAYSTGGTAAARYTDGTVQVRYSDGVDANGGNLWSTTPNSPGAGYLPQLSVDPSTGTLVVAYYSAQFDASGTRSTMMLNSAIDMPNYLTRSGAIRFRPLGGDYVTPNEQSFDQIRTEVITTEPIPSNGPAATDVRMFGNQLGLFAFDSRVTLVYPGNLNVTGTQLRTQDITIAGGPRVIAADSGPILGPARITSALTGTINYNPNNVAGDGRSQFTGFFVEFDRVIDPSTFNPDDVKVIFRSPTDNPIGAGTSLAIASVVRLDDIRDPIDNSDYGSKRFFITLTTPQTAVGTYSYHIGANTAGATTSIKDRVRDPKFGYTNTGVPKTFTYTAPGAGDQIQDFAGSATPLTRTVAIPFSPAAGSFPAGVVIGDITVRVNVTHELNADLQFELLSPSGQVIRLMNQFDASGQNFTNTDFNDGAALTLAASPDTGPYTGTYRPVQSLLTAVQGANPGGNWSLRITDLAALDTGVLNSFSIIIQGATAGLTVGTGNFMDQDGDGISNETPFIVGGNLVAQDGFSVPDALNDTPFILPYAISPLPISIPGPRLLSTRVFGQVATSDQLVKSTPVSSIDLTFDRTMNASTFSAVDVIRIMGPYGDIPKTGVTVVSIDSAGNETPGVNSKFFRIKGFAAQTLSGTYTIQLSSAISDTTGNLLDTNFNAGVGSLIGRVTGADLTTEPYGGNPLNGGAGFDVGGKATVSVDLSVADAYLLQQAQVNLTVSFPSVPPGQPTTLYNQLEGRLIHPDGTVVLLFADAPENGAGNMLNLTLTDDSSYIPQNQGSPIAIASIEDGFVANGTNNPTQPLSQLINKGSNGTWKLQIRNLGTETATIEKFLLLLDKPVIPTGLGEDIADQTVVSFRIALTDGSANITKDNWSPVGPAPQVDLQGVNSTAGRVSSIAVDPSDPSGNTVYAAGASGGIWRTTNFLTRDIDGPVWIPLADFGPNNAINVGYLTVYNSPTDPNTNGDPNKTVILVGTGSQSLNVIDEEDDRRFDGIGFLLSEDAGKTWQILDSTNNYDAVLNKYRPFVDVSTSLTITTATQAGTTATITTSTPHNFPVGSTVTITGNSVAGYNGTWVTTGNPTPTKFTFTAASSGLANGSGGSVKADDRRNHAFVGAVVNRIEYEKNPDVFTNRPIIWAAVGQGITPASANVAGLWRSTDGARTWVQVRQGEATDFVIAQGSQLPNSGDRPTIAYLAIEGEGVYFIENLDSPTPGFTLMAGGVGRPTVQTGSVPTTDSETPNGDFGRITLATPAFVKNSDFQNNYYQRWLYAAVANTDGSTRGLYVTKDRGYNWTKIKLAGTPPGVPFGGFLDLAPEVDAAINPSPGRDDVGGNHSLTLAVDPTNPSIVYFGSNALIKVDITLLTDPYNLTMYNHSNDEGGIRPDTFDGVQDNGAATNNFVGGGLASVDPNTLLNSATPGTGNYEAVLDGAPRKKWNHLNLDRDPYRPFRRDTAIDIITVNGINTVANFTNSGRNATWTVVAGEGSGDFNWVSQIVTFLDPITGMGRMAYAADEGITTAVINLNTPVNQRPNGSANQLNGFTQNFQLQNTSTFRTDVQVTGVRNGNLQTARFYSGDTQPSIVAASIAQSLLYGAARRQGDIQVSPNDLGQGAIVWDDDPFGNGNPGAVAARIGRANYVAADQTGGGNVYILRRINDMPFETPTNPQNPVNFFQISKNGGTPISFTNGLFQSTTDATGAGQWTNNVKTFAVNPIDPAGIVMGSDAGRLFLTRDMGLNWNAKGEPARFGNTTFSAFAFGAPLPSAINLNDFVYAGTNSGNIFVTTTGGGNITVPTPTQPVSWTNITTGAFGTLDGSAIMKMVANPTRGSHELFAVTRRGIYRMADWDRRFTSGPNEGQPNPTPWENITTNIRGITYKSFGHADWVTPVLAADNPNLTGDNGEDPIMTIAVDWRPTFSPIIAAPVLYVGGDGGVFRAIYDADQTNWARFTNAAEGAASDGGGLPYVKVTDIDLALGNIDPNTGRPVSNGAPDAVVVSTLGRGMWAIGLDAPPGFSGPRITDSAVEESGVPVPNNRPFFDPIDFVTVTFDRAISPATFTTADVVIKAPDGTTRSPVSIVDISTPTAVIYRINFGTPLNQDGSYVITVGPDIASGSTRMDQDGDAINGEAIQDQFKMTIVLGQSDISDFVKDVYQKFLNRFPTTAEFIATTVKNMTTARLTALGVVLKEILQTHNGSEARNRLVTRLVSNGAATGEIGNVLPGYTLPGGELANFVSALQAGTTSPERILRDLIATQDASKDWYNDYFVNAGGTVDGFLTRLYADLFPGLGINPITMLPPSVLASQRTSASTVAGRFNLVTSLVVNGATVSYNHDLLAATANKTTTFRVHLVNLAYAKYVPTYTPTATDLSSARSLMAKALAANSLQGSEWVFWKILSSKQYFDAQTQNAGLRTNRAWVESVFQDRLGRNPSTPPTVNNETDTFSQKVLDRFIIQRGNFVQSVVFGTAYRNVEITKYFDLVHSRPGFPRTPTTAERNAALSALANGATFAGLIAGRFSTTEFYNTSAPGTPGVTATTPANKFAQAVYIRLFGVLPTPSEEALLAQQAGTVTSRKNAVLAILAGQRYRDQLVTNAFNLLLGVPPTGPQLSAYSEFIRTRRWEYLYKDMLGAGAAGVTPPNPATVGIPRQFWEVAN